MTIKITDLENQPQQQHTSSIIKDSAVLQTLSEEELEGVVGGCSSLDSPLDLSLLLDEFMETFFN